MENRRDRRWHARAALRLVFLFVLVSLVAGACGGGGGPTLAPATTPEPTAAVTPEPVVTPEPSPTRKPATRVPPRPANVTFKKIEEIIDDTSTGEGVVKVKMTWDSPDGVATDYKVWGVTRCVNESRKTNKKPCLVAGQALKKGDLELIATFKGSARSGTLEIPVQGEVTTNALFDRSEFYALVLGAYNEKGESVLAIVTASKVCWQCTY